MAALFLRELFWRQSREQKLVWSEAEVAEYKRKLNEYIEEAAVKKYDGVIVSPVWPADRNPPNPKQRYGDMKAAVHMVPPALTLYAAQALGEGARKYGPYNWRDQPVEALTYIGACLRHLYAWMDGEEIDPDSTEAKHHLAGAVGSLAVLIDAKEGGFLIDNRPKAGPAPKLLAPATGRGTAAMDAEYARKFIDEITEAKPSEQSTS